jgi:glycosyltransferase involved in cell wall biosynthesis
MTVRNGGGTWPVAIFAHNEERHILECLHSLEQPDVHRYVLANGCTDGTERLVARYAARAGHVDLVPIPKGDKANAWNVFVHDVAPRAEALVFIDGDVSAAPGAVAALARTLAERPHANAAAAVPQTGRHRAAMTRMALTDRLVLGNLYALRGSFVDRLRAARTRMPIGYIGEDGWVTSMAKWNGDPAEPWDETRVEGCPQAGFRYRSFSPLHPADWKKYWRRRVRYSLRHYQHLLLRDEIEAGGLPAMPASVQVLYAREAAVARLRPRPSEFVFDWLALNEIRDAQRRKASR